MSGLNFAQVELYFEVTFCKSREDIMRSSFFMLIASLGVLTALSVANVDAAGRGGGGGGGPPSFANGGGAPSFATGQSAAPTSSGTTFSNGNPPGFSEGNKTG